jgi:3-methylcrotonyl-CoA carboxylase alpha subunit
MPKRLNLSLDDQAWTAEVSDGRVNVSPGDANVNVESQDDALVARHGSSTHRGIAVVSGDIVWVTIAGEVFPVRIQHGRSERRRSPDQDAFTSPMPATVVRIAVAPGTAVKDGDVLISLEAMKMELPIRAPRDGVVRAIHCREGDLVQPDQPLLELE